MQLQPKGVELSQLLYDAAVDGARHASNVLTQWLGRYVRIDTDGFTRIPLVEFSTALMQAEAPIAAVQMGITGDLGGHVLLSLPLESAEYVAASLLGMPDLPNLHQDELARSCVQETGNIVASAYLGSIGTWLDLAVTPSAPQVAIDLPGALIEPLLIEQAMVGDSALLARTDFHLDDVSIGWAFYMLPSPQSMQVIEAKSRRS